MKHYLKQFTELVTDSTRSLKNNPFLMARLRLTAFYTAITMTIVTLFSVALFATLQKNVHDIIEENKHIPDFQQHEIIRTNIDDIENTIVLIDYILLFVVTLLGYIIAGKTLQPLQESVTAQKRFLADVSHDLRTPLAIMQSGSQVLEQSNSTKLSDYKELFASNQEEIYKMSHLIGDLLTLAHTENVPDRNNFEVIDIQSTLADVIKRMRGSADSKRISITTELSQGRVGGNKQNLERVFQNIIQNSITYTNPDGNLAVTSKREGRKMLITITDTGVGISQKDLPFVFERFYKASHSRNDASGSGLGLSIAKQIIEQHGGTISVTSKETFGTRVTISLPYA